jgi:cold shock CspA family protein
VTESAHGVELTGRVEEFDDRVGLGLIAGDDGRSHRFHCVEIADGTRAIAVGTRVRFELLPKFGRYEAGAVRS